MKETLIDKPQQLNSGHKSDTTTQEGERVEGNGGRRKEDEVKSTPTESRRLNQNKLTYKRSTTTPVYFLQTGSRLLGVDMV